MTTPLGRGFIKFIKMIMKKIVVLTGAGISAESGIKTFRDSNGLWEGHDVMEVASPEGWAANRELVLDFYNQRRRQLQKVEPNAGHLALVELEKKYEVVIITQNVDDLHERAGSRNVLHMHGELLKVRCGFCDAQAACTGDLGVDVACPECAVAGGLRPHVVWFGEMPLEMERIYQALEGCGLFLSIGTSGNVWPAAGFVAHVKQVGGAHTAELNLEPSEGAVLFDETHYGPATKMVPTYIEKILTAGW